MLTPLVLVHGLGAPGGTAQQRADARQQLVQVVGLEHIVVGAGVQPGDAVGLGVARGGDQHRRAVEPGAQRAQHAQAVAARQAQVQHHQVVGVVTQRGVGHVAITHPVDGVMLGAQQVQHGLADHRIVFHQEQAHGQARGCGVSPAPSRCGA
jgi:hypothetical protein